MEGRVLLIEDHDGNRTLLTHQFVKEGFEVAEAVTAAEGIKAAIRLMPQVIVLSLSLPDMPGVDVARRLREINRTKHVFLMLIGDKNDREQRLAGLDLGANDFIDSPFDPELVALRVRNAIHRKNLDNLTDPATGLPAGRMVHDELLNLIQAPTGDWALMRFRILKLEPLREVYGLNAGEKLVSAVARLIAEALARDEMHNDFLGYGGHDDFIVITHQDRAPALEAEVRAAFEREIGAHYHAADRERGYLVWDGQQVGLAALRVRSVTPADGPFYDIRSLSEAIAG
ncbi:MAG TPA: response regulator [Anaerolineae bacterium]|nr:response regulator [Anaerolineae bacterium]HQJ11222.1 response regulator [Anaerolineae bacterium]